MNYINYTNYINYISFIIMITSNKSQKLPAIVLAWENLLEVFVMLVIIFILLLLFICRFSSFTFSFQHHLYPFRGLSSGFWTNFVLSAQLIAERFTTLSFFNHSIIFLLRATVLSGHFLPTGVFYLTLLPDIFGTTCFYQGFTGSRQLLS